MTPQQLELMAERITASSLADMQDLTDQLLDRTDRAEIASKLTSQALWMLRKAEYLNERSCCGSDNGHDEAVKRQNKVLAKVRKALRFTYPADEVRF